MPVLEWIGKDKVVNHHMEVPYRVLEQQDFCNDGMSEDSILPYGQEDLRRAHYEVHAEQKERQQQGAPGTSARLFRVNVYWHDKYGLIFTHNFAILLFKGGALECQRFDQSLI